MDTDASTPTKPTFFKMSGTLSCGLAVCVCSLNGLLSNLSRAG